MRRFQIHRIDYSDWEVPSRYSNLKSIGHGAQGSVCSAFDAELQREVAIKKLSKPLYSQDSAKRTYRELKIIHHMDHDNVICLIDAFTPQSTQEYFQDVYFVTPLMNAELAKVIHKEDMTDDHISFFVYQILRGLKYIHSSGIIHRDLTPRNIAINEDNELRILDFGLSRKKDDLMTGYVVSRYYRAPELIFTQKQYTNKIDIWSVGCIMAEMIIRKTLFPGFDKLDQLKKILEISDMSNEDFWSKICSEQDKIYFLEKVEHFHHKDFNSFFQQYTKDLKAIDLISKMLVLDPDRRINATDALSHPYLSDFHDETDEPTAPDFHDEIEGKADNDLESWKNGIWHFIQSFVPKITNLIPPTC